MTNLLTQTAPKAIYLQISDEVEDYDQEFPYVQDYVTWCSESVLNCEVEYIRADLVEGLIMGAHMNGQIDAGVNPSYSNSLKHLQSIKLEDYCGNL